MTQDKSTTAQEPSILCYFTLTTYELILLVAATASIVVKQFRTQIKMVYTTAITVAAAALIAALPVNAGLYTKNSPVVQVDGKTYDRVIAQSNYTSVLNSPSC